MSIKVKLTLYVVFLIGACLFGYLAYSSYSRGLKETAEAVKESPSDASTPTSKRDMISSKGQARSLTFGACFFGMIVGLGLLVGHDVSQYFGNRTLKALYNDEGEGVIDREYEIAEQTWADGHHLDAVRLMREYLQKNPREQHVALRIAEIYEKDLNNNLAAALEYEEVLKHKLESERWGWAAIHLCNLYFKLDQEQKAVALLRRIDGEYGETAAADKARKRLAQMDLPSTDTASIELAETPPAPENPTAAPEQPTGPKLPPGFTLKKR
jgi:hypothetical protein